MASHAWESTESEPFSFEPFTRHPFFTQVNRWVVERVIGPGRRVIVDLGCGPGAVTRLILEYLGERRDAHVIGIDPSPSAIERARAAVSSRLAEFVQGTAEALSRLVSRADAVIFLNAVHLTQDKAQVFHEVRKVLNRGGAFAFNSTFFAGAYVEGTSGFWRRWVVRSVQVLKEKGIVVRHQEKATAMQWLTPEAYAQLLLEAGFAKPAIELVRVELTPDSLRDIGHFSLFITGALPGVPLEAGAEALEQGLERTLDELGVSTVPRNWMECVAEAAGP